MSIAPVSMNVFLRIFWHLYLNRFYHRRDNSEPPTKQEWLDHRELYEFECWNLSWDPHRSGLLKKYPDNFSAVRHYHRT